MLNIRFQFHATHFEFGMYRDNGERVFYGDGYSHSAISPKHSEMIQDILRNNSFYTEKNGEMVLVQPFQIEKILKNLSEQTSESESEQNLDLECEKILKLFKGEISDSESEEIPDFGIEENSDSESEEIEKLIENIKEKQDFTQDIWTFIPNQTEFLLDLSSRIVKDVNFNRILQVPRAPLKSLRKILKTEKQKNQCC